MNNDDEIAVFGQAPKQKKTVKKAKVNRNFIGKLHFIFTLSLVFAVAYLLQLNSSLSNQLAQASYDKGQIQKSYEEKIADLDEKLSRALAKTAELQSEGRVDTMMNIESALENKKLSGQIQQLEKMLSMANSKISDLAVQKPSRPLVKSGGGSSNPFANILSSSRKPANRPSKPVGSSWEDSDLVE